MKEFVKFIKFIKFVKFIKFIKFVKILRSYGLTILPSYHLTILRSYYLSVFSIIQLFIIVSCDREDAWDAVKTRGEPVVVYESISAFNGILVHNDINVIVNKGDYYELRIEGWKNLIPKISFSIDDEGILEIKDNNTFNFFRSRDNKTTIYLTYADELNYIELRGNGYILANDTINASSLIILCLNASGCVNLKVKTEAVYIGTNGYNTASVTLVGETNSIGITNWGYNSVHLFDLKSLRADIHHHGTGKTQVNASETLSVVIYGLGNVYYMGKPSITFTPKGKGNIIGI